MNRRGFLGIAAGLALYPMINKLISKPYYEAFIGKAAFNSILSKSEKGNWNALPINELIIKIANEFIGKPYLGGTLEGSGPEICRINLDGLDCVTLVEASLCMARIIKKGDNSIESFIREVSYTRYRGGILDGYASRLHYTADWIADNISKGVVEDITKAAGGERFNLSVGFMSKNPKLYPKLGNNDGTLELIRTFEENINKLEMYFIPKKKVKDSLKHIKSGDIIAIATNKSGLDYSHMGLASLKDKKVHLLHASSTEKKVILDKAIEKYLEKNSSSIGITIVRAIET